MIVAARREKEGGGSTHPRPCRGWLIGALVTALAASLVGQQAAAQAGTTPCRDGISRHTTERLFAVLNHAPAEADCRFEGVQTNRTSLDARWSRSGTALPPVHVVPRQCSPDPAAHTGPFVVEVPAEIGENCPSVLPLIAEFVTEVSKEAPVGRHASVHDPLYRGARGLFIALALVGFGLLVRGATRFRSLDASWVILGMASFSAALAVRAALPFSLGNWYSEVMPAVGPPPWMRFGPGYFALQSLLRDAGLWNARTLVISQLLIGAAAVPLLLGVLRELRVGLEATAATLVLFILAPFHARLSATASEHVLASTLCVALLLCWLRAARRGDLPSFAAAVLLFPAVCATRADMAVQASLVLLWPLVSDRHEREAGLRRWPPLWMVAAMAGVGLVTLSATYQLIVLPSQHPQPDWRGHMFALRWVVPQFWLMATNDPAWMSPPAVVLALAGALAMAVRRPLLFVRVAGTVLLAFVAAGRTFMHDELVGARYFLFTIPIFLIASGYGFEAVLALAPRRLRPLTAAAGIAGLALWAGLTARPAYAARYAFQDEYAFARSALAQLPAACAVYQVAIRDDALPHDVDCCLDLPRSPLVLDFPALQFFDLPDDPAALSRQSSCVAYYESVACDIMPGPPDPLGYGFAAKAAAHFQDRCASVHRLGRLELIAHTTTSPRSTENFFAQPPNARLYRWLP